MDVSMLRFELLPFSFLNELSVGTYALLLGELRRLIAAPGQPHSNSSAGLDAWPAEL